MGEMSSFFIFFDILLCLLAHHVGAFSVTGSSISYPDLCHNSGSVACI